MTCFFYILAAFFPSQSSHRSFSIFLAVALGEEGEKRVAKDKMHPRQLDPNAINHLVPFMMNILVMGGGFMLLYLVLKSNHDIDLVHVAWEGFLKPNYDADL